MPLTRLIYVSRRRDGDGDLARILDGARRANARDDITGALLVAPLHFVQLVEGRRTAVGAALARILRDPRHESLAVVSAGEVRHRLFPDWRMEAADRLGGAALPDPEALAQVDLEHLFRRLVVETGART